MPDGWFKKSMFKIDLLTVPVKFCVNRSTSLRCQTDRGMILYILSKKRDQRSTHHLTGRSKLSKMDHFENVGEKVGQNVKCENVITMLSS